ncbi:MAG: response regulator transcription factor [Christensenellaceae bacterium]|nr:response regulator transcription factor [Christensenellaceae bacterium]
MRLLIIDDDPLVTNGIKVIIEGESQKRGKNLEVCGLGKNGREAVNLYKEHKPDIVLMDIRMPEMDGIEAGKAIIQQDKKAKIIFLTTFLEDEYIIDALKIGAKGYILKTDFQSIYPALEAVMSGQNIFGDAIIEKIPGFLQESNVDDIPELNDKENEIVYWIAQGLNNRELAEKLYFSEGTVRNYISIILEKLSLRNRTEIAIFYYKNHS